MGCKPTALSLFYRGLRAAQRECYNERKINIQLKEYFGSTTRGLPIAGFSITLNDGTYFDTVGVAHGCRTQSTRVEVMHIDSSLLQRALLHSQLDYVLYSLPEILVLQPACIVPSFPSLIHLTSVCPA